MDNMNLVYQQYHAEEQIGTCDQPPAVVSLDRFTYLQCPGDLMGVERARRCRRRFGAGHAGLGGDR